MNNIQVKSGTGFFAKLYETFCRPYVNNILATEISSFSRYFDCIYQILPLPHDTSILLNACDAREKKIYHTLDEIPSDQENASVNRIFLLNGNCNYSLDIEGDLRKIQDKMLRSDRLVVIFYNPYLHLLFQIANFFGVRSGAMPRTFVTKKDIRTLSRLAGLEITRRRPVVYLPAYFFGIGTFFNRILQAIPFFRWFSLAEITVFRPIKNWNSRPSISIVIPARNEKGNISNALERMPDFQAPTEVIFIEGHSSDNTWEEIQRILREYKGPLKLKAAQQSGKGKSDAVRLGFSMASHEVLTILDADLTMPPEHLPRFYEAYVLGLGDFINGNRLVYPMEGEAMRFLNHLGNIFFAKLLSFVLETELGDSLCGTKLMTKHDYDRFTQWRHDFGDFDPFGDFEIIFPACILGLGVMDMPVHYRARTYGSTNIHRFRHGFILLKMSFIGLLRIRVGKNK